MCGCNGAKRDTTTVWYVVFPNGVRSSDFSSEADARAENNRRGGTGVVTSAQVPR